jgi:hypothetical protein
VHQPILLQPGRQIRELDIFGHVDPNVVGFALVDRHERTFLCTLGRGQLLLARPVLCLYRIIQRLKLESQNPNFMSLHYENLLLFCKKHGILFVGLYFTEGRRLYPLLQAFTERSMLCEQ